MNKKEKNKSHQRSFKVYGLDCPEEISTLKQARDGRAGVIKLKFDALRGRMTIEFNPDNIDTEDIIKAVAETGMKAVPWEKQDKEAALTGFWETHGHSLMAAASGILIFAALLSQWTITGRLLPGYLSTAADATEGYPLITIIILLGAIITGAWFVAPKALNSARRLRPNMHLLMILAVIGAMAINEWFEAATVAFLFAVSLWLERWSVGRARRAIEALLDISPANTRCINETDGSQEEKPTANVEIDERVLVRPGEKIPLDGFIINGSSSVDQAPITGESVPASKKPGDTVYAGTINGEGALTFQVTHRAEDTTLARIIHMVEEAESRRAPAEQWVDKFARWYTPAMILLALVVALFPPLLSATEWTPWFYRGLVVLVIACPCALVISTPVSIVAGLTSAARAGILIKGGVYLEIIGNINALALDKTGTLTYGQPMVQKIIPFNDHTEQGILRPAASLESQSEHPLARAIEERAREQNIELIAPTDFQAVKGKGAEGTLDGTKYWIGGIRIMQQKNMASDEIKRQIAELEDKSHTVIAIGNEKHICGLISLADTARKEAAKIMGELKQTGVREIMMLTGDNEGTARAIARETGIESYKAAMLPEDKVKTIEEMTRKYARVAMVGDGINDAPAMARADLSVAMGSIGTDAAIETGDITLMSDDLSRLPWLIRHSRRTLLIIKQNIIFALGLKALFLILALLGSATLWMAIAADTGASLLVIFNGLRLLKGK